MSQTGDHRQVTQSTREAEWIRRISEGDRNAFQALYAEYAPRVFRFVVRMIRDEAKSEEVANDVMLQVWKGAGRFEGRSSPSTWILGIARNRALNAVRGNRIETEPLEEGLAVKDETPDVEASIDRHTLAERLRTALDGLSPQHREVVELTFFQGCSYREIAEIVSCPENTVKTRMFHAKKRLKPLLSALAAEGDAA